ncbi:Methyltransferase domain-containing protein [Amycolatopsis marina]|uniref:Methyltransferase domain-containing protein n=1 Tax=Amycolatopsis marina TaxID=490629 RepID=A0A1I1BZH6_9PSEU|nr:class I SAM-dependent methyltransferase [Amycolatopsis marina]SFB55789.1 Methyltransferase domain-containing protein [Amycolatopsis marina]
MTEHDTQRLRGLWERYAPRYDREIGWCERVQFGDGRAWVCDKAEGEVLEVAIGTGRNLPYYPDGIRLTGIDFSPAMLGIARRCAADLGRSVDLREGDAQQLPFPDASFDTVVCTLSLCGIADERTAIAEMYRVLRPGGTLLLLDHIGSQHALIRFGQRLLEKITVRTIGDYQTRRPLPIVQSFGFVVQEQQRLKAGTVERLWASKPANESE